MQRAAEIAAQVFTARDALRRELDEDDRVAFLLLDSAAETLMVRTISSGMAMRKWDWGRNWRESGEETIQPDLHDLSQRERESAGSRTVLWQLSETQRRNIERDFNTKVQLLAWDGAIPSSYVATLRQLHNYRNEMYHREESRPAALRTMAHLYAWLVAELLDRLTGGWFTWSSSDPDDLLQRTYARMGVDAPEPASAFDLSFEIQSVMADALRRDLKLETAPDLLADYVASRVEDIHSSMHFCADFLASEWKAPRVTEMDVVRLVYSVVPVRSLGDLSGVRASVTRRQLETWDAWPKQIRRAETPLDALLSLAEFEAGFEPFETKVRDLSSAIDIEVQRRFDLARGK